MRGEDVNIHDVGGRNPKDFDVLLTDVDYDVLKAEISELGGIPYLQKATKYDAEKKIEEGTAMFFGPSYRVIFPAVVNNMVNKAYWIYFIIDTGAPFTYLSTQAADLLDIYGEPSVVSIAGFPHPVHQSPATSHFSDINKDDKCLERKE